MVKVELSMVLELIRISDRAIAIFLAFEEDILRQSFGMLFKFAVFKKRIFK